MFREMTVQELDKYLSTWVMSGNLFAVYAEILGIIAKGCSVEDRFNWSVFEHKVRDVVKYGAEEVNLAGFNTLYAASEFYKNHLGICVDKTIDMVQDAFPRDDILYYPIRTTVECLVTEACKIFVEELYELDELNALVKSDEQ